MNNERRKRLKLAAQALDDIRCDIEDVLEDEDDARNNIPESLQDSDQCVASEYASEAMIAAISDIDSAIDSIEEIV